MSERQWYWIAAIVKVGGEMHDKLRGGDFYISTLRPRPGRRGPSLPRETDRKGGGARTERVRLPRFVSWEEGIPQCSSPGRSPP